VDRAPALEAIVAEHSEALFGRSLNPSQFRLALLAGGTRQVYRIEPSDHQLSRLVLKVRSPLRRQDPHAIALQTEHEFAVHSSVHQIMGSAGRPEHGVPRPLLALPGQGMLFMEEAPGSPVARWMSREAFGLARGAENDRRVRRCGEWLFTFAVGASRLPQRRYSEADERVLSVGRVNHHVYCLIGLTGASLMARMLEQVRHRLKSYRIEESKAARIQGTFEKVLSGLEGDRDLQGNVHGKYSIADVLISPDRVQAIDLEQTSTGTLYLDPAYFLYQLVMITRWRLIGRSRRLEALRGAFLAGRVPGRELDVRMLDAFIAYFLVNSLRPGGGVAGLTARARAAQWIDAWVRAAG
jgi:hypothetical protein